MALLPTGSDKILEINTAEVNIVIKSKKNWSGKMLDQSSSIVIDGHDIKRINIEAAGVCEEFDDCAYSAVYNLNIAPVFFEQTD